MMAPDDGAFVRKDSARTRIPIGLSVQWFINLWII